MNVHVKLLNQFFLFGQIGSGEKHFCDESSHTISISPVIYSIAIDDVAFSICMQERGIVFRMQMECFQSIPVLLGVLRTYLEYGDVYRI